MSRMDQEPDLYDEPPQEWSVCEACGGEGEVFSHMHGWVDSGSIDPPTEVWMKCSRCRGAGGWLDDRKPDSESNYCPYRHFTDEEEAAWQRVFDGTTLKTAE